MTCYTNFFLFFSRQIKMFWQFMVFFLLSSVSDGFRNFYGEWTLWHSTTADLPDNRVVVHIYPDNQLTLNYRFTRGPMVCHKSKTGVYSILGLDKHQEKHRVDVSFHHKEELFLSVYGIGLQNFNIRTKKEEDFSRFSFVMTMDGTDDIYLQSTTHEDDCFHIVRSVRINEPSVDIPISTFLITQIIGTIIGHIINQVLFHSN